MMLKTKDRINNLEDIIIRLTDQQKKTALLLETLTKSSVDTRTLLCSLIRYLGLVYEWHDLTFKKAGK